MQRTEHSVISSNHMFEDREEAGKRLAKKLAPYSNSNTIVYALPRGGVVLGFEVARELECPLGLIMVRKISHPTHPEYAIGALVDHDQPIYNKLELSAIDPGWLQKVEQQARDLIAERHAKYFSDVVVNPSATNKTVIIVDDGMATGLTMEAACRAIRKQKPLRIIVGVPVASQESIEEIQNIADDVIVLQDARTFGGSVGTHYRSFPEITDQEVEDLLLDAQEFI